MTPRPRRTPEEVHRFKRAKEGRHFELYGIHPALQNDGYQVNFSHMSKGPYDHAAWKIGQLLVIAARLTPAGLDGPGDKNPKFHNTELAALWEMSRQSKPGFEIVPLVATALHAAAPGKTCLCGGHQPDPARFLRLTGPPARASHRGNWEPWTPDQVAAAA